MAHLLRGAGAVVAPRAGEPVRDINPDDRIVQRLLATLLSLVAVPTLQRQPLGRAVLCVPLAAEPVGFSAAHEQRSVSQAQRSSARRRPAGALAHPMLGSSGRLDSRMVTTAAIGRPSMGWMPKSMKGGVTSMSGPGPDELSESLATWYSLQLSRKNERRYRIPRA